MKDYRLSFVMSSISKLKGDQRIDGYGVWSCLSFVTVLEECEQIGLYIERNG